MTVTLTGVHISNSTKLVTRFTLVILVGACVPGTRFTNGFVPAIQIRWKLRLSITPLLAIRSQQIFAHATTAQLSCHVNNFVAITVLESRWEWNEIFIELELRRKNRWWNGPLYGPANSTVFDESKQFIYALIFISLHLTVYSARPRVNCLPITIFIHLWCFLLVGNDQ